MFPQGPTYTPVPQTSPTARPGFIISNRNICIIKPSPDLGISMELTVVERGIVSYWLSALIASKAGEVDQGCPAPMSDVNGISRQLQRI